MLSCAVEIPLYVSLLDTVTSDNPPKVSIFMVVSIEFLFAVHLVISIASDHITAIAYLRDIYAVFVPFVDRARYD